MSFEVSMNACDTQTESNARITQSNTDVTVNTFNNSIECIQLEDSDDESHQTPRKRAKLLHSPQHSPQASQQPSIPSLPSPLPSPQPLPSIPPLQSLRCLESMPSLSQSLASHSPHSPQLNGVCDHISNSCQSNSNSNSNGSERCDEHNGSNDSNGECNSDVKLTHIFSENKSQLNDRISKSETLIKRLISLCVEKRFDAQIQRLNTEQNWIKRVKSLKTESADRNIELKLIKRANKMKTPTVFSDIGIQTNFSENNSTDNIVNGSDVSYNEFIKIKKTVEKIVPSINDLKRCPILENELAKKEINASEVLKQNGIIKSIKSESNEINSNAIETKSTVTSDNTNLDKDIITIDSDDDDNSENNKVVNDEHLKADFSLKVSKYNDSLPVPKLSVSYSKLNNTNKHNVKEQLKSVTLKWSISQTDKINNKIVIEKYLIYMYKDPKTENSYPIGCVVALDPPMACTLSNLSQGKYNFYVRAFDSDHQMGPQSNTEQIEIF